MSYEQFEESARESTPVELYEFVYGGGFLRYTSRDRDIVAMSFTWTAAPLERSAITASAEISKANLQVTCPPNFPVAQLFHDGPPSSVVMLRIRRVQLGDLADPKVIWMGRVLTLRRPPGLAVLVCESVFTSQKRPGPRFPYSRNCPHVLFGPRCRASKVAHETITNIDTQDGRTIIASTFEALAAATGFPDYLAGGEIRWFDLNGVEHVRGIKTHAADTITITHAFPDMPNGAEVKVYPGCNHSDEGGDAGPGHCGPKFNNRPNHGGTCKYQLRQNPFGQGASVFFGNNSS